MQLDEKFGNPLKHSIVSTKLYRCRQTFLWSSCCHRINYLGDRPFSHVIQGGMFILAMSRFTVQFFYLYMRIFSYTSKDHSTLLFSCIPLPLLVICSQGVMLLRVLCCPGFMKSTFQPHPFSSVCPCGDCFSSFGVSVRLLFVITKVLAYGNLLSFLLKLY